MSFDDDYANAAYIPNAEQFLQDWEQSAREYREVEHSFGRAQLNQRYGEQPGQAYDLFFPAGRPDGLMVFVHGGYWMRFGRRDFSHLAQGATLKGWAVAILSYPLAPSASILEITHSVATAITKAAAHVAGPIVLAGHSAGGHLVARMGQADIGLTDDIQRRIKRIMPISPVGDLRPLLQTEMNDQLQMDDAIAQAQSPSLHSGPTQCSVHVWVGAKERPAFLGQAKQMSENWKIPLTVEDDRHHFDVIEGLEDPDSLMMQTLLADTAS